MGTRTRSISRAETQRRQRLNPDLLKPNAPKSKVVTHQHIWKPAFIPGGVVTATLCGRKSAIREDAADLNVGENVSCKFCLTILKSDRPTYNKRFVGMTCSEVEAISQSRMRQP